MLMRDGSSKLVVYLFNEMISEYCGWQIVYIDGSKSELGVGSVFVTIGETSPETAKHS